MIKNSIKKIITAFITISMLFSSILNLISVSAKSSENVDAFTFQVINTDNIQIGKIQLIDKNDPTGTSIEAPIEEGNDYADFTNLNAGDYDVKFLDKNDSEILDQDNSAIITQISIDSNDASQTYVYDFNHKKGDFQKLVQTIAFTNDNIENSKMTATYGQSTPIIFKATTNGKDSPNANDNEKIEISYSIKNESENTQKIAAIDVKSGEVTINGIGTVTVVATASGTDYYAEDNVECELTIQPATMQTINVKPYDGMLGDKTSIDAVTVDSVPDGATVEYSVNGGTTYSKEIPKLTQEGEKKTIIVKVSKPNYKTVTDTVVAYLRKEADISFENIKNDQLEKSFEDDDFNLSVIGNDSDISGTFSLKDENNGVLTVDEDGKVSIISDGSAIINYSIEQNDDKCIAAKTISVKVIVKVPDENKLITINSQDDGNIYSVINKDDKKITYYTNTSFILNTINDYEIVNGNTITSDINDCNVSLMKNGKLVKTKSIAKFIEDVDDDYTVDFVIDKQTPTLDGKGIKFAYDESFVDRMFRVFGIYYDNPITCTINNLSDNNGSGIKSVSLVDKNGNVVVDKDGKKYQIDDISNETEVNFTLPVGFNFKGDLYYRIIDNVGNGDNQSVLIDSDNSNLSIDSTKEIIIETVPPDISVAEIDKINEKWFKYNSDNKVEIDDINFECSDEDSGIYSVEVKVNNQDIQDIINKGYDFKESKNNKAEYTITGKLLGNLLKEQNITYPEDGKLNFEIIVVDNAGNETKQTFTIKLDKDIPSVSFDIDTKSIENVTYDEGYGYFFKKDTNVTITASDDNGPSSGVESITYWTVADAGETIDKTEQKVDENNQVSFTVKAGFKGQIYAYATDNVGWNSWNNSNDDAHPDGIVIENGTGNSQHSNHSKATITYDTEEKSMEDADGKHKLFNNDVQLTLYVEDTFSGLSEITYSINDDKETIQIPDIRDKENPIVNNEINGWKVVETDKNLVTKMSKEIVVDASKYNLNDIQVKIEAKDNVENEITASEVFSIDKTEPKVSVTYTGNDEFSNNCFKTDRTATISVQERNFDKDAFIAYIAKGGEKSKLDLKWTDNSSETGYTDDLTYTATYTYDSDADYIFSIDSITDLATNKAAKYQDDKFTIDKTKPNITDDEMKNVDKKWFKFNENNEIEISDINFICSDDISGIYSVKVKANDNTIIDEQDNFKNERIKNNKYEITRSLLNEKNVTYPKDGVLNFEITLIDNAGNEYKKTFTIYLDKDIPSVSFAIDTKSIENVTYDEGYGYFFKKDTNVTITASDDNGPSSGVESITYWTVADAGETIDKTEQKVDENNQVSFTVKAGFKGQIYAYATDNVGWDNSNDNAHPDGTAIENGTGNSLHSNHSKATITYDTKEKSMDADGKHKLFNSDVQLTLYVEDTFSGLSEITYSINDDKETIQIPDIRDKENPIVNNEINGWKVVETDKNLVTKMSKEIVVDASKYNLNDIQVKIEAKDNVTNEITASEVFSIDKTEPKVSVTYTPETGDESFNDYYKTNRTGTITVQERNFDKDAFIAYITKDGKKSKLNLEWTDNSSETGYTDNLTYTATYTYDSDADYIFSIDSITDLATNKAAKYTDDVFTIDKTKPVVRVSYDNNSFLNENYYNKTRIATITITEHNFETSRINITGTATDNGATVSFPAVSGWSTHGDDHSATIVYDRDALYTFDIDYIDKAGNQIDDFTQEQFYVDMTAPTLDITNVADHSANAKEVKPIVSYSDTNFDANAVTISMVGANKGKIELDGVKSQQENGEVFAFNNPAVKKENDDMYTINASVTDKAGNETTKSITYSVNRFGSVYTLENKVKDYNGKYTNKEFDVVVVETNVDTLHNMKVSVGKNNTTNEINQYQVTERNVNGSWKQYQYTIDKDLFKNDGRYSVLLYSEDSAGNINENIDETKKSSVNFGIDKTKPSVVAINVENGVTYAESSLKSSFSISDNLVLDDVEIKLNDKKVKYNSDEDVYSFTIPDSTSSQNILVTAKDAAGNITELEIADFYVTTNLFVRWFNNKPLFIGSIAGTLIIIGGVYWFFIAKRKNESEEEQE